MELSERWCEERGAKEGKEEMKRGRILGQARRRWAVISDN